MGMVIGPSRPEFRASEVLQHALTLLPKGGPGFVRLQGTRRNLGVARISVPVSIF